MANRVKLVDKFRPSKDPFWINPTQSALAAAGGGGKVEGML